MTGRFCENARAAVLALSALALVVCGPRSLLAGTEGQGKPSVYDLTIDDLVKVKIAVSSLQEKTIFNTPSAVYVIDRRMIDLYNISSVREALRLVAGFSVTRTYLMNDLPTSRGILQDHYANKVLFMIDGTPCWLASTGEANINRVSIHDVERIEILKGPASVLYGTNAYSGAVNVVLRSGLENQGAISLAAGNKATYSVGGSYGNSSDDYDLFISGNSYHDEGDYRFVVDEVGRGGHFYDYGDGANLTLSTTYKSHSVLFNGFRHEYSAMGVVPRFSSGLGDETREDGYLFGYSFTSSLFDRVGLEAGLTYDWNRRDLSRAEGSEIRANVEGYRVFGFVKSDTPISESVRLELGADYDFRKSQEYRNYARIDDTTLADNNLRDKDISEFSVFSQLEFTPGPLTVILGARYTDNALFGSNTSTRGTVVYSISESNSAKLIFGQSFRAPSLFELYFITPTFTVFGNPDLEPEKSTSVELAYLTVYKNLLVQALVYHASYDNKIFRIQEDVILDDGTVVEDANVYANGSRFEANGIEIETTYQTPAGLNFFLNYSFIDGDNGDEVDGSGHYNFKYVSEHTGSAGVAVEIEDWKLSGLVNFSSDVEGPDEGIGSQYTVDLDLAYARRFSGLRVIHSISVKNLFDEETVVPEYVRRKGMNEIPMDRGRRILYSAKVSF